MATNNLPDLLDRHNQKCVVKIPKLVLHGIVASALHNIYKIITKPR